MLAKHPELNEVVRDLVHSYLVLEHPGTIDINVNDSEIQVPEQLTGPEKRARKMRFFP